MTTENTALDAAKTCGKGPFGPWASVGLTLGAIFIMFSVQSLLAIPAIMAGVGDTASGESLSAVDFTTEMLNSPLGLLTTVVAMFFSMVILFGIVVALVQLRGGPTLRDYLGAVRVRVGVYARWLLILFAYGLLMQVVWTVFDLPSEDFVMDIVRHTWVLPLIIPVVVIASPIAEESLFRGFLYAAFDRTPAQRLAVIVVSAAVWSGLHAFQYQWYTVLGMFGMGVVFGFARWLSGSLYVAIALHAFWNLASTIIALLIVAGLLDM
ncbi:MAG: CPBP family intramembrane metalloprotease [Candidatus Lernaella stagnicola]|nr:CPBP family intramembrane metalloprotease [Candidatus Lernaella stagnicola]